MATRGGKNAIAKPTPPAHAPCDVETIERLQQWIQELEFQQFQQDSPAEETETESNEEESPFVNEYPSFQEEHIMLREEELCPVYDTDNEEDDNEEVIYADYEEVPVFCDDQYEEDIWFKLNGYL
ncbi:hypothetical protein Tco_0814533 [Tanacetum coccineum]